MPGIPLPADPRLASYEGLPIFFNHYWFSGTPEAMAGKLACFDYNFARDGPLLAYRWAGEIELRNSLFVSSEGS
jgi:hypothetical protein